MSRVGKKPIQIPSAVKVKVEGRKVVVQGPKGELETSLPRGIEVALEGATLVASRQSDEKQVRALHGLTRALLANSVKGVSEGFRRELDVVGIGFKAEMRGKFLNLALGFSHPIEFPVPKGIQIGVERIQRQISNYIATVVVTGADKEQVGQVCADIRGLRPPDPYKGKGIRYSDEVVRLKEGKKGA